MRDQFPTTETETHIKCDNCSHRDCDQRETGVKLKQRCTVEITRDLIPTTCGDDPMCVQCFERGNGGCHLIGPVGWKRLTGYPHEHPPGTLFCPVCDGTFKNKGGRTRHINVKHPEVVRR